jgi:secreted trypsin-like serine protease
MFLILVIHTLPRSTEIPSSNAASSLFPNPSNLECGGSGLEVRIVGGEKATLGQWTWLVSLFYKDKQKGIEKGYCGGTLITQRYVITAGHCVQTVTP